MNSPVKTVYARTRQLINPGDAEDLFFAVMTLANGAIVQAEYTISVEKLPDWFIQGDRGTIVVRGDSIKLCKSVPPQPDDPTKFSSMKSTDDEIVEITLPGAQYGDQNTIYAEIARAIGGESPFAVTPEDALELSRVLDAIRASSEKNEIVNL